MGFVTSTTTAEAQHSTMAEVKTVEHLPQHDDDDAAVVTTSSTPTTSSTGIMKRSFSDSERVTSNNTTSSDSASDPQNQSSSLDLNSSKHTKSVAPATTYNTFNAANSIAFSLCGEEGAEGEALPEEYARKLVAQIHRRLDQFLQKSPYISSNGLAQMETLPRFHRSHLNLGRTLAKGGFSNIIELTSFQDKDDCVLTAEGGNKSKQKYVIKSLSTKLALKKLPGATKDIVFEAHTLASLNHDHIIKLRGVSQDGIEGYQTTLKADGFFLILDRLGDTLFQRVFQWQNETKGRGRFGNLQKKVGYRTILKYQFQEKIQIAVDIASALAYCHEKRILHRDIKSANVAFRPTDGRAVLIDFGLACEVAPRLASNPHRTYELTGNIGTARYMSPEVILEKPYNEKADVHSFAVLCWEACAAKKPYSNLDAKKVKEHVSKWNERPKPYWSWPRKLRKILKKGWAKRQEDRPTMAEFHRALLKVQASLPNIIIDFTPKMK